MDPFRAGKEAAGRAAADLVPSGARLGLGTGSTVAFVLERLAERMREGLQVVGVPTSEDTARRARELGLELGVPAGAELDLVIDGADEVGPGHALIKGGGGALLREKIVAAAGRELVVVVSANKVVERLGAFPLPVEVVPFGWEWTRARLAALGCEPTLRTTDGRTPFVTDGGHWIVDCAFGAIDDPGALEARIDRIPGVVESGLFVGMAERVLIGHEDGRVTMQ